MSKTPNKAFDLFGEIEALLKTAPQPPPAGLPLAPESRISNLGGTRRATDSIDNAVVAAIERGAHRWDEIRKAANLSNEQLSAVVRRLMLDRAQIFCERDFNDERMYYLRK